LHLSIHLKLNCNFKIRGEIKIGGYMKKSIQLFIVAFAMLFTFSNCKKDSTSSEFTNKITLGTGTEATNAFNLTGESSTFYQVGGSALIYFRLESADDMGGSTVILDFETTGGSLINTISRPAVQNYGHIMVSSFNWEWQTGNYTVKAYLLVTGTKKFIASKDFTIQ
jgi:hypothetical protein